MAEDTAPRGPRQPGCGQRQFCADLRHWRVLRGMSLKTLGARTQYSREFVTKVEHGERWPTEDFARRADAALDTGGVLLLRWPAADMERQAATAIRPARPLAPVLPFWQPHRASAEPPAPVSPVSPGAGGGLAALVGEVLREYPGARIVLAIDSGPPLPGAPVSVDGAASSLGPAVPDGPAPSDGARVYWLSERRAVGGGSR